MSTHEVAANEPERILARRIARPLTAEELELIAGGSNCYTTYDTNDIACDCDQK